MAGYDNSRYTYQNVLKGNGYYQQDTALKYSEGVETMQTKLNKAGFWCGTPDGKFGAGTDAVVRNFQDAYSLTVDGKAGKATLLKLDEVSDASAGFTKTSGSYGVYFNSTTKKFMYNQQVVYERLKAAGLRNIAIAGFMGNFQAEHEFKTSMAGGGGSVGLAQWRSTRKEQLEKYAKAVSKDILLITVQADFVLEECKSGGTYNDRDSVKCFGNLKDTSVVKTVRNAADYVTALYERCHNHPTWEEMEACDDRDCVSSRYDKSANDCNNRFYLDAAKRRGYAQVYYDCICKM